MAKISDEFTITVFDEIDDSLAKECIAQLIEFSANPTQEITMLINSDGGCMYSMFAIHDMMLNTPNPIRTIGMGRVMSAAALLLAAGDEREITPTTSIMLHEPCLSEFHISEDIKVSDLRIELEHIEHLRDEMYKLLSKYTGRRMKSLTGDLEGKDFYLTAKEAKRYGLVDRISRFKNRNKGDA